MADKAPPTTTYDRPVRAVLHVHLEGGESWEATAEDLKRFGLVTPTEVCAAVRERFVEALDSQNLLSGSRYSSITSAEVEPLRVLVEETILATTTPSEFLDETQRESVQRLLEQCAGIEETLRRMREEGLLKPSFEMS